MLNTIVDKKVKMNRRPASKIIDIEDIKENELNRYSQDGIEDLADNIQQYGLLKPLEVYENDGEYILIGGHRRLKALKMLFHQDLIDSDIPCLVYSAPEKDENNIEERIKIVLSNAQRDMTEQDKIEVTKEMLDILSNAPGIKEKEMPTVQWLSPFLGCSPRTAQKYINAVKYPEGIKTPKDKKNKKDEKSESKSLSDLANLLSKFNKQFNEIYWKLSEDDRHVVIDYAKGQEITVEKMISKLSSITDLYIEALNKAE